MSWNNLKNSKYIYQKNPKTKILHERIFFTWKWLAITLGRQKKGVSQSMVRYQHTWSRELWNHHIQANHSPWLLWYLSAKLTCSQTTSVDTKSAFLNVIQTHLASFCSRERTFWPIKFTIAGGRLNVVHMNISL